MIKFLVLDLRIMRPAFRALGIILGISTLGLAAGNTSFFLPFVTVFAVMAVMNLFATIEQGELTQFLGALPARRADVMRGHYLFVLVAAAVTFLPWLVAWVVHLAAPALGVDSPQVFGWFAGLGGVLTMLALMIPCIVKWGTSRGVLVLGVIAAVGMGLTAAVIKALGPQALEIADWWALAAFAAGLAVLAISLPISTRIYQRQDH
ncbi:MULTISPECIES: ABC-2 transporter permease [unclassified Luteococcus]|uniref:ABC-2 transporter permease n=1 Tax=unclassified Luteococcus TaxID=2639923 RepID=UPI00313D4D0D